MLVKPTELNWEKFDAAFDNQGNVKGWTERQTWQIEIQNSKDIPVIVDVRRSFAGDWSLDTTASYEKVDATKVKFLVPLKAREKTSFTYTVTLRHGTNKTR